MSGGTFDGEALHFHRCRFETRLPTDRAYTPSHHWLREIEPGLWQIGFTAYGTRLLGEIVDFEFTIRPGGTIEANQIIGWIEGFKAVSDLYSVAAGEFAGENAALREDITRLDQDPYGQGWVYLVRGAPEPPAVDAREYVMLLNAAIDVVLGSDEPSGDDA